MTTRKQIKAIIKQYADKGERLLKEAYGNGDHASTTGFWEGFKNCAENLLRELEDIQEESVNEDLDSFATKYAQDKPYPVTVCQAVKVGANWQKEQMMAKAVDVTISIPWLNGYYTHLVDSKEALPFGDNIKVLVIKED